MFEELLALKAEAETEILYATAKKEVVEKLMVKFQPSVAVVEPAVAEICDEVDSEIEGL
jgi:hypothetical protein